MLRATESGKDVKQIGQRQTALSIQIEFVESVGVKAAIGSCKRRIEEEAKR